MGTKLLYAYLRNMSKDAVEKYINNQKYNKVQEKNVLTDAKEAVTKKSRPLFVSPYNSSRNVFQKSMLILILFGSLDRPIIFFVCRHHFFYPP